MAYTDDWENLMNGVFGAGGRPRFGGTAQPESNVYDYLKFSFDFKSDEINKTRKPLSRDKTVFPILWGSWEN